jgi:allantoate deiminase
VAGSGSLAAATEAQEVIRRCRLLAECSEEPGVTTRTFLSPPMRDVHRHLRQWMEAGGMTVSVDAAGNLRGLYPASVSGTAHAARLFIGSHLDTVPRAGAFDGVLGVVLGVALVESLGGRHLPFAIEVVGFSEEEGVRFGVPFIGSRALTGGLDDDTLGVSDARGRSIGDAIRDYGLDPSRVGEAQASGGALGYLEFHIEQGPVLDILGLPLGIVNAIVGQSRFDITFTGAANHAGTTPMTARRDAVAAAAEWIVAVERTARDTDGLVATVGRLEATPGAVNVIAGSCVASLDVRHPDDAVRAAAVGRLMAHAQEIAASRGIGVRWDTRLDQASTPMDPTLVALLDKAVLPPAHHLSSGAGHDAMIMATRMPVAMLFLRSPGGISHHPDEAVREDDVAAALAAGRQFLELLAERSQ